MATADGPGSDPTKTHEPRGLIRGRALTRLLATLRPRVEADAARLLAKGRKLNVRVDEYTSAQRGEDVKAAVRWLLGPRKWRYVSFAEFVEALERLVDRLHASLYDVANRPERVCFVVDSLNKSSFWIVLMALLMRPFPGACLAIDDVGRAGSMNRSLIDEDTDGMLLDSFRELPDDTRLVLMDDAAYSGEQLSHFHEVVIAQWRGSRALGRSKAATATKATKAASQASIVVALPFISRPATPLFRRRGTTLMFEETFPGLFERRSAAQVLAADLFIEVNRGGSYVAKNPLLSYAAGGPSYPSLFFDVLGILPTNAMFVFEHKIGDSLSIPNRWLKVGQCVPPSVVRAYRVRKDRAQELMTLLRRDLASQGLLPSMGKKMGGWAWTPAHRLMLLAAQRTGELLSSSARFRSDFFDRVDIPATNDAGGKPAAFLPLLSPEFCDAPYRRYVRRHRIARGELGLALPSAGEDIPPCRKPPYKRTSFRRRILIGGGGKPPETPSQEGASPPRSPEPSRGPP